MRRRIRAGAAADSGLAAADDTPMNTSTSSSEEEIFHKLLLLGVRPITRDRTMLERLGFTPHFETPKTRFHAKIWSRPMQIRGQQVTQYAFLEQPASQKVA